MQLIGLQVVFSVRGEFRVFVSSDADINKPLNFAFLEIRQVSFVVDFLESSSFLRFVLLTNIAVVKNSELICAALWRV